jgi:hypothetical protein
MPRLLRNLFGAAAALLVALSITAAIVTPPLRGVVSGGIRPCDALGNTNLPHYAAGTVTVLKGQVTWRSSQGEPNYVDVLPTTVVVQGKSIPTNGMYRFDLDPGRYVLEAAPPGSYGPYSTVTLNAGDDLLVDIPNTCI